LGAAAVLLSLIAVALSWKQASERRREIWFWAAWAAISVFLTLGVSAWVWRHVPLVPYAQFPWRYLMLAIVPLSILPGTLVADCKSQIANRKSYIVHHTSYIAHPLWPALLLSCLLLLSSAPYFKAEMREPTKEQGPVSMAALMRFQRTSDDRGHGLGGSPAHPELVTAGRRMGGGPAGRHPRRLQAHPTEQDVGGERRGDGQPA
jgi:hypothetical protein